jgi:hypothetical protein
MIAPPIPAPRIAPVLGPTIVCPIRLKLKFLPACFASTAFFAIFAINSSEPKIPLPTLAAQPTGANSVIIFVNLPIV